MGQFTSLCKNCDTEMNWFLEIKDGITCRKCGVHNIEKDVWDNFCGLDYHNGDGELYIKKRKSIRERKIKINKIKKSM